MYKEYSTTIPTTVPHKRRASLVEGGRRQLGTYKRIADSTPMSMDERISIVGTEHRQ